MDLKTKEPKENSGQVFVLLVKVESGKDVGVYYHGFYFFIYKLIILYMYMHLVMHPVIY